MHESLLGQWKQERAQMQDRLAVKIGANRTVYPETIGKFFVGQATPQGTIGELRIERRKGRSVPLATVIKSTGETVNYILEIE